MAGIQSFAAAFFVISTSAVWAQEEPTLRLRCSPGAVFEREELLGALRSEFEHRWGVTPEFRSQDPKPQNTEDDEVSIRQRMSRMLSYPRVAGNMGINAMPAQRAIDPRISDRYTIGTTLGYRTRGSEKTVALIESLDLPLGRWAAMEISLPFEYSSISESRRQELGLPERTSAEIGDVAWAFRVHLNEGTGAWNDPDLGLRAYTQSASGSNSNGRFNDAARYAVEGHAGWQLFQAENSLEDLQQIRGVAMLGLDVPQDRDRQVDRLSFGGAAQIYFRNGMRVDAGTFGYIGYADNDTLASAFATLFVPLSQRWNLAVDVSCGLNNDTPDMVHVTFGFGDKTPFID